jgi:hypothetical protein
MAQKNNFLSSLISEIVSDVEATGSEPNRTADIITFCESPSFLNLLGQDPPLELWPMQKVVLKLFYRGTRNNEQLKLSEDEIRMLGEIDANEDLDYKESHGGFKQIMEKYHRGNPHNMLLLVMGRRSSKTLMVSIIAAYEAYKLLELPDGNPHKYYSDRGMKLSPDKPIAILNVAVSEKQAYDPMFLEIESRITRSPYFTDKINNAASRKGAIYMLTEADRRENARRKANGIVLLVDGSVVLLSGHSNSQSLRGKAAIAILFDEYAHFIQTDGRTSGDEAYRALTPSAKQFGMDGRIVLLSDPMGQDGMFWKLFEMSQEREVDQNGSEKRDEHGNYVPKHENILALQLPTWCVNPNPSLTRAVLEKEEKAKDPISFACTWGARFLMEQGNRFFDEKHLTACTDPSMQPMEYGDPRYSYHIHLDPATSSHNYALAMCHAVTYSNPYNQIKRKVFLDYVKFWTPTQDGPVDISKVEDEIKALCRRFRVVTVTFDQWQSQQTIQRLRGCGINAFETRFNTSFISVIYGELKNLVIQSDLLLYPHYQLLGEMKCLKYKVLRSGFHRFFDRESEFPSDDCVDALAGAAYQSLSKHVRASLPRSTVVHTGRR